MKTLREYCDELATIINGTVQFTSPNYGAVGNDRGAVILAGPTVTGWDRKNERVIAKYREAR